MNSHIISTSATIKEALIELNKLGSEVLTLFAQNLSNEIVGSITDGDIRRHLAQDGELEDEVQLVMNKSFEYLELSSNSLGRLNELRARNIRLVPVLDKENRLNQILDLNFQRALLPLDVVLMAGGVGKRLRPLTIDTPKPLLPLDGKAIIQHNLERLKLYGVSSAHITINYLGQKIEDYFQRNPIPNFELDYVREDSPLGTMGSLSLVDNFRFEHILVMNSDLLTDLNYEDMYSLLHNEDADMVIATYPYEMTIPYGVVETSGNKITNIKEKPSYIYYSNAGIYILDMRCLDFIPHNTYFDATDLIKVLLQNNKKIINFPISGYWLDIGSHESYKIAQTDITRITF